MEEDDASKQDDEPPIPDEEGAPPFLAEGGPPPDSFDDGPPQFSSDNGPFLFPDDADEYLDGEVYAAVVETLDKMHSAPAPKAPKIYVPPESFLSQTVSTALNLLCSPLCWILKTKHCFLV
jgi:hypothetical protein